ncbi:MAG: extracellular solute-binding protein, partial [Alphaproteobacteria bacterium]
MKTKNLVGRLADGTLTRRDVNKMLAGTGLSMVMVPAVAGRAQAAGEVTYFGWSGLDDENFYKSYIEKYGGLPNFSFWGDEDEAFQKMVTGGFTPDVMYPCAGVVAKWQEAGLLRPLELDRLENLDDMFESLHDIEGSIIDGQRYFMPMDWGNSTVIYRTDLVDPEYNVENSWKILYDERYAGRLAVYDFAEGVIGVAALTLGYDNIFSLTDEQLAEVRKVISKQRDILRFYWSSPAEIDQALAAGELVAAYGWNESYVRLKAEGVPVGMMVPKEGIITWCCGLVMHADTKNETAAYDMINSMTSPETGAYEIEYWGYGVGNQKAFDLVAPETLEELGLSTPDALLNAGIFLAALDPETEEKYA